MKKILILVIMIIIPINIYSQPVGIYLDRAASIDEFQYGILINATSVINNKYKNLIKQYYFVRYEQTPLDLKKCVSNFDILIKMNNIDENNVVTDTVYIEDNIFNSYISFNDLHNSIMKGKSIFAYHFYLYEWMVMIICKREYYALFVIEFNDYDSYLEYVKEKVYRK